MSEYQRCNFCNEPSEVEVFIDLNEKQSTIAHLCNHCLEQLRDRHHCPDCRLYYSKLMATMCDYCNEYVCPRCSHPFKECQQERLQHAKRRPWQAQVRRLEDEGKI